MSESSQLAVSAEPQLLNEREQAAYDKYVRERKEPLAPSTAAKFFELFLQGHGCEEIQKLNPGFPLGLIVKARLDYRWDEQRQEYMVELLKGIRSRVQQSQLEAVVFAADGMAVYHKLQGDKFKKFLQSGNVEDLGSFKDASFKTYKDFVDMLLKLTGQDTAKSKVSGDIHHHHVVEQAAPKPMTPEEARQAIRGYVVRKK